MNNKMCENRLIWFWHVMRREKSNAGRMIVEVKIEERNGKGRP